MNEILVGVPAQKIRYLGAFINEQYEMKNE
jgi:hypothetical protein